MSDNLESDEPIKLGPCSNGEYVPAASDELVREARRRTARDADELARRLGMDRRRFLASLSGAALALVNLAACSRERHAAERATATDPTTVPSQPGGTFTVPPVATTEPAAATTVLSGSEFIFDVQTHLLPYDLTRSTPNFGSGFPQAACGERDSRKCFDLEHFLDAVFLESDTNAIVLSALPIYGNDNPLTADAMAENRDIAARLCGDERVFIQAQAAPNFGPLQGALDLISATRAKHKVVAWKTYTHTPRTFRLDDAATGTPFLRHIAGVGPRIVAVHKGFGGDPADIGPAAAANPDIAFLIYHSGYESGVREGAYDPARPNAGVDRLLRSLERGGIGPNANVYVELGSTWRSIMGDPNQAAHVLGKLLKAVGAERVLWGTDSIWYGSPQDQIMALRAFEISAEFQERYGYPALSDDVKRKIFGLNASQLFGVKPQAVPCRFTRDDLQRAREQRVQRTGLLGPRSRRELVALLHSPLGAII